MGLQCLNRKKWIKIQPWTDSWKKFVFFFFNFSNQDFVVIFCKNIWNWVKSSLTCHFKSYLKIIVHVFLNDLSTQKKTYWKPLTKILKLYLNLTKHTYDTFIRSWHYELQQNSTPDFILKGSGYVLSKSPRRAKRRPVGHREARHGDF